MEFFMNVIEINVLVLAYLGDAIYENYVRKYLINKGISNVNDLQTESIKYVSAKSQAKYLKVLMDNNFFMDDEISIIKRARNYKTTSHPKNCDIITYKYATGLEALIGYLDLTKSNERINEIMNFILED
jgi:ribonuclease-3 family protein